MTIDTSPEALAKLREAAKSCGTDHILAVIDALEEARIMLDAVRAENFKLKGGGAAANHTQSVDEGPGVQAATGAAPYLPQRDLPMPKYEYQSPAIPPEIKGDYQNDQETFADKYRRAWTHFRSVDGR
jgi:hypothetical protein